MPAIAFTNLHAPANRLWPVLIVVLAVIGAGAAAFLMMDTEGHSVTGMTQRVPWGVPHVFAYFLILAASGAINVAVMAAVFGRTQYKPLEPFSALLAIALLAGGLTILVADLGRPDRVLFTLVHRNNTSIFAWNTLLYTGFLAIAAAHLATLLDRRYARFSPVTGHAANLWRFALTTGTGLDLGVLVARSMFGSAMFAPQFISYSLTYGLAVFLLLLPAAGWLGGAQPDPQTQRQLGRLLAILIGVSCYLTLALQAFNLYDPAGRGLTWFLWLGGGLYTALMWLGLLVVGTIVPLVLIARGRPLAAAGAVAVGGFATLYVFVVGSQAFPQPVLPGLQVSSAYGDGTVAAYTPSAAEWLLGLGGVGVALLVLLGGCLLFRILPARQAGGSVVPAGAAEATS